MSLDDGVDPARNGKPVGQPMSNPGVNLKEEATWRAGGRPRCQAPIAHISRCKEIYTSDPFLPGFS